MSMFGMKRYLVWMNIYGYFMLVFIIIYWMKSKLYMKNLLVFCFLEKWNYFVIKELM